MFIIVLDERRDYLYILIEMKFEIIHYQAGIIRYPGLFLLK